MEARGQLMNIETLVPEDVFIYSQTDLKGHITEANESFAEISGYSVEEMTGKPHNIVRHPDMPREAFADMWKSLKAGRPWQGLVKNRRRDGGFYWVQANVSPVREGARVVGYQSLRRRPERDQVRAAEEAYRLIREGKSSLRIEEGVAVHARGRRSEFLAHPSTQIAWASYGALAAAGGGVAMALAGDGHPALRIVAMSLLLCSAAVSLFVRLQTLPRLQRDLDGMANYLDRILSSGDLTLRFDMDQRGRSGVVARKLSMTMNWIHSTVECIGDAVGRVGGATAEALKDVQEIDKATNSQNMATSSVAAAATELSLTIREMSDYLKKTEQMVTNSGRRATEGADLAERASASIESLAHSIKSASSEVEALGTSSAEVGQIAGVIREIADQTNLLALNASIEAARAGEAGRGFAVVANEVRRLADRTMQATGNIDALIVKIKGDSERAIAGMRTGASEVNGGVALVRASQDALIGINGQMSDAVRMVSEIAVSSSQQTEAMNEIGANITHVAAMTEQSVGFVRSTTELMEGLSTLLGRVEKAIGQYQT
ncbi:MAG TPA: PAS domain-containing methyl-accepting chemotaxis protein [Terracidiphilus sp.]|jgi:aerotaxis receptor|nr:PAS domain-containing methyl-accepting chemotaxis protein [Terracidiphilus sp.]